MISVNKVTSTLRRGLFSARYALRMRRGRRAVTRHLEAPTRVPVPMPTFVQFRITNLCNLRCKMCGQWGDTGIFRQHGGAAATDGEAERARVRELIGLGRQLGLRDYERVLDEIAPADPVISLFGGEPLLYPDLVPLVRAVKRRGLTLTLITNGWLLEKHAKDLVSAGIDAIAVSVDGPEELHDRIRGRESSFARLAEGVRAVARARDELGSALPTLLAILPITELNADAIGPAMAALGELPLDVINLGLRWFIPPEVGARYESVMTETFGVAGESWKGFEFSWPGGPEASRSRQMVDLVKLLQGLKRGRAAEFLRGRPWRSFVPAVSPEDVPSYFTDFNRTFGHDFCPVAWYFAQIEPDGDVCFCGDFPDYVLGNVGKQPFGEIWNGPRAGAFRAHLAREPLPVCARCCGSYVYGRWKRPEAKPAGS